MAYVVNNDKKQNKTEVRTVITKNVVPYLGKVPVAGTVTERNIVKVGTGYGTITQLQNGFIEQNNRILYVT